MSSSDSHWSSPLLNTMRARPQMATKSRHCPLSQEIFPRENNSPSSESSESKNTVWGVYSVAQPDPQCLLLASHTLSLCFPRRNRLAEKAYSLGHGSICLAQNYFLFPREEDRAVLRMRVIKVRQHDHIGKTWALKPETPEVDNFGEVDNHLWAKESSSVKQGIFPLSVEFFWGLREDVKCLTRCLVHSTGSVS